MCIRDRLISSLCLYKWTPGLIFLIFTQYIYISVPITVSFGLLPSFHRAWSLHWKIIQLTTVYVWWLPCVNCKYWLTCGFTLLEHTSFDQYVNMSRPIWVLKIVLIKIISHSTTWLFTWTCKDTFSWTDLICVFRFSFYVNYLPHWLQGYLNFKWFTDSICCFTSVLLLYCLSQSLHEYLLIWTDSIWLFKLLFALALYSQW